MPVQRLFLGWDRPALPEAAGWLLGRSDSGDLSSLLVVVPGSRVGRLLLSMLAERVREGGGQAAAGLSPPTILTPGNLGAALLGVGRSAGDPAGGVSRRVAWMSAIAAEDPASLAVLTRCPPGVSDPRGLAGLAGLLEMWAAEIGPAGYRLGEVARIGEALPDFADADRWLVAGSIQDRYEGILAERGLHDADLALLGALADPDQSRHGPMAAYEVVLVGVSELSRVAREALARAAAVTSLVPAPESEADRFDEFGCVIPEAWAGAHVPIGSDRVMIAEGPSDQAMAVLDAIAGLGGRFSAEQIVVGAPDAELAACVESAGHRVGVEFRSSAGTPLVRSAVCRFLAAAAAYIRSGSFDDLAALARHPDVERMLAGRIGDGGVRGGERWLGAMDRFRVDRLPDSGPWPDGGDRESQVSRRVREAVVELLGPLASGERRTAGAWGPEILAGLSRLYRGRVLRRDSASHEPLIRACDRVREAALDLCRAPAVELGAAEAIDLLLDVLAVQSLAPLPSRESIEVLGWLELPLDPAPVAVVTGLNEGVIPSRPGSVPMLPESLRSRLGVPTSAMRLARDAFLLTVVVRSRPHSVLVAGRRSSDGDPLPASRLLFSVPDGEAVERLGVVVGLRREPARARVRSSGRGVAGAAMARMPVLPYDLPASLPVTAFGMYLRSPYTFYLRHVARVRPVAAAPPELGPSVFGTLAHRVFARFAEVDAASSDASGVVAGALCDLLSAVARDLYGARPRPIVSLQIEALRGRLGVLAEHQARRAGSGWRILRTEWSDAAEGAALMVDGVPMGLRGSIDRIDRHEGGGLAILDYKAGEAPGTADEAHRAGRAGDRRWIDLQLPLYRHLARSLAGSAPMTLGYIRVGAEPDEIGFDEAGWSEGELESADAAAFDVVRRIRRGEFRDPGVVPGDRVIEALCASGIDGGVDGAPGSVAGGVA